ncbi:MAG: hypothetical protein HY042_07865 [Spirochaetia bacterium]|nr:hypothetical protein [Spirochaetia bacterium]
MRCFAAVLLLLAGGLWADAYVPGDDRINERDILERMRSELGEEKVKSTSETQVATLATLKPPKVRDALTHSAILTAGDGSRLTAEVVISPRLYLDGRSFSLSVVRELHFDDWKIVRRVRTQIGWDQVFAPVRCHGFLTDGAAFEGRIRPDDWMTFEARSAGKSVMSRTYFHAKDTSGVVDGRKDVIVSIEFSEEGTNAVADSKSAR